MLIFLSLLTVVCAINFAQTMNKYEHYQYRISRLKYLEDEILYRDEKVTKWSCIKSGVFVLIPIIAIIFTRWG